MADKNPLLEVFGFATGDFSDKAVHYRKDRLCPFNNKVPNCTKDKAQDPLGVCTISDSGRPAIVCPVRFRQDWVITSDAASVLFPPGSMWTTMQEVTITDAKGASAGNLDYVLVSYDHAGRITDFGAMEVQSVYISGNLRRPFAHYMEDPKKQYNMDWSSQELRPRADYLSSSRKRLLPQLIYKGSILNAWGKKMIVALHEDFFGSLPAMEEAPFAEGEIVWLLYGLLPSPDGPGFSLKKVRTVPCRFQKSLDTIMNPRIGNIDLFVEKLQNRLDGILESEADSPEIKLPQDTLIW